MLFQMEKILKKHLQYTINLKLFLYLPMNIFHVTNNWEGVLRSFLRCKKIFNLLQKNYHNFSNYLNLLNSLLV